MCIRDRSLIGRGAKQIATAEALGLKKPGDVTVQPDNAATQGKICLLYTSIAGVKTTFAGSVNTYDVLNADKLIISVDAAKKLEEVLG